MTSLMCNSFPLTYVKAVLGYFRSLPLPKKQAVAGILPNQVAHSKVLLRGVCLPPCFLIHVWMPGIQRQNEMTQETGHYEGRTDCNVLFQLLFLSMAEPTLCSPQRAVAHWLVDDKSNGASGLSPAAKLSRNTKKPQPKSESFSSQTTNPVSK